MGLLSDRQFWGDIVANLRTAVGGGVAGTLGSPVDIAMMNPLAFNYRKMAGLLGTLPKDTEPEMGSTDYFGKKLSLNTESLPFLAGAAVLGKDPSKAVKGLLSGAKKGAEAAAEVVRAKRRVGTTGQYVGAPPGIDSPQKYSALIDDYVKNVEKGLPGKEFYNESSADVLARTAGDAKLADQLVENLAVLSRSNNVGGNTTMSAKGHIQAMTGDPIHTGRFPSRDVPPLREIYQEGTGYLGHKRSPFAEQLSVAWAPDRIGRGVNDMHELESMGYPANANPSGTVHAFMDEVRAEAIKRLNKRGVGGVTDWNTGTAQAANWTANKIRRGEVDPGDAAKTYATYFPRLEANATYEAIPGAGTGHLAGLLDAPFETKLRYSNDPSGSWLTPYGNDVLYAAQGMLPGKTASGVGRFRDEVNPANIARPVIARETNEQGQALSEGSRRALTATEAFRAYMDAQNAGAWHKLVEPKAADQYTGAVLNFGQMDEATMKRLAPVFESKNYWLASAPDSVTVLANDQTKQGKEFAKEVRGLLKESGLNPAVDFGRAETGYASMFERGGDGPSPITRGLLSEIEKSPTTMRAMEAQPVRDAALARNARDLAAQADGLGVARQDVIRAREIFARDGWAGLKAAAEKGIVPATVLAILLPQMMDEEP
jgi:hypothetical protein